MCSSHGINMKVFVSFCYVSEAASSIVNENLMKIFFSLRTAISPGHNNL